MKFLVYVMHVGSTDMFSSELIRETTNEAVANFAVSEERKRISEDLGVIVIYDGKVRKIEKGQTKRSRP